MNILKNNFWVLVAILLLTGSQVIAQNIYKWTDELELLKRVDKLPEYRTDSYVEQFSSYDRKWGLSSTYKCNFLGADNKQ